MNKEQQGIMGQKKLQSLADPLQGLNLLSDSIRDTVKVTQRRPQEGSISWIHHLGLRKVSEESVGDSGVAGDDF